MLHKDKMAETGTPILLDDFVMLYVLCDLLPEINVLGENLFRNTVEKLKPYGQSVLHGEKILLK